MANELRILIVLAVGAETFRLLSDAQSPVTRHIFLVEDTTAKGAPEAIPYHYLNRITPEKRHSRTVGFQAGPHCGNPTYPEVAAGARGCEFYRSYFGSFR